MKRALFVATSLVLVGGFFFAAQQFRENRTEALGFLSQEQAQTFVRPHSPRYGPSDAKVFLVEFTDPACETCAAFGPILKKLMEPHADKIQLVIRYAPFHEGAVDVVRLLEAARMQGKYWETLDLVYRSQSAWTEHHRVQAGNLWQILSQHGDLDMELLSQDVDDPAIRDIIEQDMADVQTLGVRKTPGIFVNGRPLEPFGVERLQQLIEEEVAASY
ncbi:MAG: DsbA family protein [Thermoanaerobaculia bacterium]|nr:DsbA family protein [Thermoanaerobaculia bacterium]